MKIFSLVGICLALCTGCVPSLHPLYTEQELVYEADLEGQWSDPESDERWNFQRSGDRSYRLVVSDDDSWGAFEAHLIKLGEHYFLDLYPSDWEDSVIEFHRPNLLAAHTFLAVRQLSPHLEMAAMNGQWLKEHLQQQPQALRHEFIDDEVLLSAGPRQLQAFLSAHLGEAFDDYGSLSRLE